MQWRWSECANGHFTILFPDLGWEEWYVYGREVLPHSWSTGIRSHLFWSTCKTQWFANWDSTFVFGFPNTFVTAGWQGHCCYDCLIEHLQEKVVWALPPGAINNHVTKHFHNSWLTGTPLLWLINWTFHWLTLSASFQPDLFGLAHAGQSGGTDQE